VEGRLEDANIPESEKAAIAALRTRQIKNMLSILMLSRGTPILLYGDEVRRTTNGNNNAWNQEKPNELDWSLKDTNADMLRFTRMMIQLRKEHQIGRLGTDAITWHGAEPNKPDWNDYNRLIAWQYTPLGGQGKYSLYSAFNAYWEPLTVKLPPGDWTRL